MKMCVCVCATVCELLVYVKETSLHTICKHTRHEVNPLRNNPLVEGVNTEAARVVTDRQTHTHKTTTATLAYVGRGLIYVQQ